MQNGACNMTTPEFAPITPDKAMRVKTKGFSELGNSCTDDRINPERDGKNNEITREMVDSSGIQHNKQLLEPVTDAAVSAASTQTIENHNPQKEGCHVVDLNRTPQQKPRRKKHRPKVVKESNAGTSKTAVSKENPSSKRRYVRKKGLNKDLTPLPTEAAGESLDLKTPEPTMESCRKTLNFDMGLTGDENSNMKICQGTEVMTPKASDSTPNPKGKRRYVRKKGIDKEKSPPREAAQAPIDMKTLEPTKELYMTLNTDINFVPESQANDFCPSKLTVQLGRVELTTPKSVTPQLPKEHRTGKRKYVRKQGLNKETTSTPVDAAGEPNDLKTLEPVRKSCRRTLNFDIEGQPRDENSTSKSGVDLDSEPQRNDMHRTGTQSKSIVQLGEGIEVIVENTQAGIAYDLTRSVNQLIKDYISSPEGQAPQTPLPIKTNSQRENQNANSGKENKAGQHQGQDAVDNEQRHTNEILLQIDSQSSPRNDSKCSTFSISIEQGQAWGLKRNHFDATKQAENGRSNLIGIHYHTLQACQMPGPHFPNIYKKKRTEKGQHSCSSSTSSSGTAAKSITLEPACFQVENRADSTASGIQEKQKSLESILALSPIERLTKKRSRGLTRGRGLASLTRITECTVQQTYPRSQGPLDGDKHQVENLQRPQTCIEALVAEMHETMTRKKRTKKRNTLLSSTSSNTKGAQKQQKVILNNHHQFSSNSPGT